MTYKQIRKEKLRIEPYFINIAKEYYKDIDLSNKNYIWQIEQVLYENKRSISEFYVNAIMNTLSLQLYPEMSYDSKFVTTWIGDDYIDIKYLIIKWSNVELYRVAYDEITLQKHSMKEILRVILYVLCCVQQRKAIKNIVKFNPFDK
jgi:hypothetical protein